ncbi:hypothetical protein M2336_002807 [Sphingobium sp. B1D7B]|uniref:hypothetical protein n=1 Tax=Sphingobium sp. B1D7B TaxID=2940578 RepID=UPI0022240075|nr:hypothetical protein [Sphingobium sp. B1D7B]MCW2406178.1 hypothetical protein [Sphingobium sp. B1D7B]
MIAIRDQIMTAAEACLQGKAAEIEVMPSGDPMQFDALHIYDDGQRPDQRTETGTQRQGMTLSIEGFVEDAGGRAALTRLNALYAATVTAIFAMADASLLIEDIEEGDMRINRVPLGSTHRLAFSIDFLITFPTRRGDPTAT